MLCVVSIRMGDHLGNRVLKFLPVPVRLGEVNVRRRVAYRRMEGITPVTKDFRTYTTLTLKFYIFFFFLNLNKVYIYTRICIFVNPTYENK
jgi:hypothetical protein